MSQTLWAALTIVALVVFVVWIASDGPPDVASGGRAEARARRRALRDVDRRYAAALRNEHSGLLQMVDQFRAQDAADLILFVVALGDVREEAFGVGIDLSDPLTAVALNPGAPRVLCAISVGREANGQIAHAGAALVWMASLRAGQNLALRQPCRDLWTQIARAFPHVRAQAKARPTFGFPEKVHLERDCFVPRGFEQAPRD